MKGIRNILLLLTCFSGAAGAQTPMMDSLKSSFKAKPRPTGDFGTRNSFIQNASADIFGFKLGVSFAKRVRIGVGYDYLASDITQSRILTDASGNQHANMHLKMVYGAVYFEYVYFKNKRWEFTIPLQLGIGESNYQYTWQGRDWTTAQGLVILYEPTVQTQYYVLKWLGLEADVGLRLMLKNNNAINRNFNCPMYAFGIFVAWDEVYKSLFPKSSLGKTL